MHEGPYQEAMLLSYKKKKKITATTRILVRKYGTSMTQNAKQTLESLQNIC